MVKLPYIIDHVWMFDEHQHKTCSILVENGEIRRIQPSLSNLRFMRLDGRPYILTPGQVFLDDSLHQYATFQEFKKEIKQSFLQKGCTTIIHIIDIRYEREIIEKLKERRRKLLNTPIDYLFILRIPLNKLTPSFIRLCKKLRIPAIILRVESQDELAQLPWGWIKESLFPRPIALLPQLESSSLHPMIEKKWKRLMKEHRLLSEGSQLEMRQSLSKSTLMKIGLYPERGVIRQGANVTYNLYVRDLKADLVEENAFVDYDNHIPEIIVHNENVIKAGKHYYYQPGTGREIKQVYPGRFQVYEHV